MSGLPMTGNKQTIERCIDGFNRLDHAQILSCLRNDVVWEMPGGKIQKLIGFIVQRKDA